MFIYRSVLYIYTQNFTAKDRHSKATYTIHLIMYCLMDNFFRSEAVFIKNIIVFERRALRSMIFDSKMLGKIYSQNLSNPGECHLKSNCYPNVQ